MDSMLQRTWNLGKCKINEKQAETTEESKSALKMQEKYSWGGENRERGEGEETYQIELNTGEICLQSHN